MASIDDNTHRAAEQESLLRLDAAARLSQKIYYDDLGRGIRCYSHLRYFDCCPYPVIMLTQLPLEDSKRSLTQTIESATAKAVEYLSHLGIDVESSSDRLLFVQHYTPSSEIGREHLRPLQPVRVEEGQQPKWGSISEADFLAYVADEKAEPTNDDTLKLIQPWLSKSVERNGDRPFFFLGMGIFSRN